MTESLFYLRLTDFCGSTQVFINTSPTCCVPSTKCNTPLTSGKYLKSKILQIVVENLIKICSKSSSKNTAQFKATQQSKSRGTVTNY